MPGTLLKTSQRWCPWNRPWGPQGEDEQHRQEYEKALALLRVTGVGGVHGRWAWRAWKRPGLLCLPQGLSTCCAPRAWKALSCLIYFSHLFGLRLNVISLEAFPDLLRPSQHSVTRLPSTYSVCDLTCVSEDLMIVWALLPAPPIQNSLPSSETGCTSLSGVLQAPPIGHPITCPLLCI